LQARVDPVTKRLADEVAAYPIPAGSEPLDAFNAAQSLATPLRIATRLGVVTFLNTITVFGSPHDVTLSELALEMLFPADERTVEVVRRMVAETAATPQDDEAPDIVDVDSRLSRSPILT